MRSALYILICLVFFSCENSVNEENLDKIFSSEKSEIRILKSHGNITGKSIRGESTDKFEITNLNNEISIKYYVSAFYNDSVFVFDLTKSEITSLKLAFAEVIKSHDDNKVYDGCCMCSNVDFLFINNDLSFEIKPTNKTEGLYRKVVENHLDVINELSKDFFKRIRLELLENEESNKIQSVNFQDPFVNLFNETEVISIVKDSIDFSFDFNLHGYDCGAPDCYSTFVDFSIPVSDSIFFPLTINVREFTGGPCMESKDPKFYTFYLAEKSDDFLIYNSRGAKKSLVLNRNREEFSNKAYYFSAINYPITLKNVVSLLSFDENTKESEMPFKSTALENKI